MGNKSTHFLPSPRFSYVYLFFSVMHFQGPPIDHHIRQFPLTAISILSPYTGLIISVVLLALFLIRFYVLERFLLQKLYGPKYAALDEINRRGFVNHHIAGGTKLLILTMAAYPFGAVTFGTASFYSPVSPGSRVKMGDLLVISAQLLIGMFIFELLYRTKISPISVLHHMGSILIGQAAITISIEREKDSSDEFLLCTVWGACPYPHHDTLLQRIVTT